jgi:hypothetical protein
MNLLREIEAPTNKCAGNWEIYLHGLCVYVKMPAGFGVKKYFTPTRSCSTEADAIYIAKEITKHSEKRANEIWKSLGWYWWDYMMNHELIKSKATKAPIV